jgi:hypothetical protein
MKRSGPWPTLTASAEGGPSLRARLPAEVKIWQGEEVYVLHYGYGLGFRAIGRQLGISTTHAQPRSRETGSTWAQLGRRRL